LISLETPQVLLIAVHQPKDRPLLKGKQDSVLPNAVPDHPVLVEFPPGLAQESLQVAGVLTSKDIYNLRPRTREEGETPTDPGDKEIIIIIREWEVRWLMWRVWWT
jgi:hypothetical protein